MSFLKDLFSRGPKLPEPVYDPFDGDEAARVAAAALGRGDWQEAARLLAASSGDQRAFLAGTFAEAGSTPAIDAWQAAQSDRPEPWLIRGLARIGEAWEARGSGLAADVEEEAWPIFRAGLEAAEADFREAIRLAPRDATPWGYLLITARGLGAEVPEIRQRFDQARRRDPRGWLAPFMALDALTEKWCGSHETLFAFAREVSASEPAGSPLHALVPAAHVERWLHFSLEEPPDHDAQQRYFARREVNQEIRLAWERGTQSPAFRPGRFAATQRNLFAFAFCLGEDVGRAQELFRQIGPHATPTPWRYLGDPIDAFKRAREDAFTL
ncbi:MAG: hypothetical protein NDJ94_11410 [Vicinamibacteria bacterium]|nr:hypothetical protein [Vicinamibacteria bacterium]